MEKLNGKIAVITGGNSGIGYETARMLKQCGATVIITGRRKEAVDEAAKTLGVIPVVADQSNITDIEALVQEVKDKYGSIDILFINAGITGKALIQDVQLEQWNSIVDINLKGAFFTLSRFIPLLKDGASVVFLSSIIATKSISGSSIYALTKAGINSIVKTAALELASRKIRVNAVSPGPTDTGVFDKMGLDAKGMAAIKSALQQKIPIGEIGNPADVAAMVLHLCTDAARFMTGAEITMDGGMTLS